MKKTVSLSGADLEEFCLGQFFCYTRRPNVYNLSYTRSFSTGKFVFLYSFLSLSYLHSRKSDNFSFLWKKLYLFAMQTLKNPVLFNFLDNTRRWNVNNLIKLGLSLPDKLCSFLHFFLYHIYIQEKEKIFPFYGRILSWSIFFWQHKKIKRV